MNLFRLQTTILGEFRTHEAVVTQIETVATAAIGTLINSIYCLSRRVSRVKPPMRRAPGIWQYHPSSVRPNA
jgi:hypothetical protein